VRRCVVRRLVRHFICVLSRCSFSSCWRSTSINYKFNQWFGHQRCRSGSMSISVT